ncbi:hypothetical protein BgiMline_023842, partial [Biomphalaria glabrata]
MRQLWHSIHVSYPTFLRGGSTRKRGKKYDYVDMALVANGDQIWRSVSEPLTLIKQHGRKIRVSCPFWATLKSGSIYLEAVIRPEVLREFR